jgi:glutamine cyclotransferase
VPLGLIWGHTAKAVPVIVPRVHAVHPHDPNAFTQGLVFHEGQLFESTGLVGRSSLRRVELATGRVLQQVALPPAEFGEGLARVGDRLIQLSWQSGIARSYDATTFELQQTFTYQTEGWGLCHDGSRLLMTDGSDQLYIRDATSFELLSQVTVTKDGSSVSRLNELECIDGSVYANVWLTDSIVKIAPATGQVLAEIDASSLLTMGERRQADVLNGIAFDPTSHRLLLTGKLWPKLFEVELEGLLPPRSSAGTCGLLPCNTGQPARAPWLWALALLSVLGARRGQPPRQP